MSNYNYLDAVRSDVLDYIREEINFRDYDDLEELEEHLNDTLWCDDGVTGNASGSYYCNSWKAEEALSHNWDLLAEALREFGQDGTGILEQGPEAMDVIIRCYLLGQAIAEALEEIEGEFQEAHDDDEEE